MNNEEKPKKNPLHDGGTTPRQIDRLAGESFPLLGKSWTFVARTRVKTWQGLFMLAFVSGAFVSFVWSVSLEIESLSRASGTATLSMTSSSASGGVINVNPDDSFDVDLVLDTGGVDVVATRAIVTYDPADFELTGADTSGSIFSVNNTCQDQGTFCQIVDNDTAGGTISLTLAKPSPGVNNNSGLIATLTFKALRMVSSSTSNIRYTFVGPDDATDSDVIEEGGDGNDLLNGVSGIRALVGAPACTDYTYSAWGTCQSNGTQTRTVESSVPDVCTGGVSPVTSQSCTYTPPVCTDYNYSAWGACQPDNTRTRTVLSGIPTDCSGGATPQTTGSCTYVENPPACTDYNYGSWGACQPDNTRTRTVLSGIPTDCSGGASPQTSEACSYQAPACSYTYTDWGDCVGGHQYRTATESPSGCSGQPEATDRSCTMPAAEDIGEAVTGSVKVLGEKVKFGKTKKLYTRDRTVKFDGTADDARGGKVELYRDGKKDEESSIKSNGDWKISVREKDSGTYRYVLRFYDTSDNEVSRSASYNVKIDSDDPKITDLPLFLFKARGEKVWWEATDNQDIDHYRYVFLGKSKTTKSKSFNIPADAPTGIHTFQLIAYDEVGNRTIRNILIRVR